MNVFDSVDDLALLLHRIQDPREKAEALEEQGAKVGLKINATKTKLMCTDAAMGCRSQGSRARK